LANPSLGSPQLIIGSQQPLPEQDANDFITESPRVVLMSIDQYMTGVIGMGQYHKLNLPGAELKDVAQILNLSINPGQNPFSENLSFEVKGPPPSRRGERL
jgi:hypothetical protein